MALNFGVLNPIQQNAQPVMGQAPQLPQMSAPQESDDGGIGEVLKGFGQLKNAISEPKAPEAPPIGEMSNLPGMDGGAMPNPNQANQPLGVGGNNPESIFNLAKQHLGANEVKDAPVLMSYFQKTLGEKVDPTTTPWCAYYANAVLKSGGVDGTGSGAARSFLKWGQETQQPTVGDVVVLSRGNDPTKGHVGFFAGRNQDGSIQVLGGNQGNSVSIKSFAPNQVLGFRRPPTGQQVQQAIAPDSHQSLPQVMQGIAYVESRRAKDPYTLLGKATRTGDQALGKYQIMNSNIGAWSKEALGRKVTRQEFLANPEIQEKIAAFKLNQSLKQGYSPQDAASIWFSGRPAKKAGNAKDAYGTTVPQYIKKFNEGAGFNTSMNTRPIQKHIDPNTVNPPSTPPGLQGLLQEFDQGRDYAMNTRAPAAPQMPSLQKPLRNLSPEEIQAIMKLNGGSKQGLLG